MFMSKPKKLIGVSACLMSCPVRYDGASRFFPYINGALANFAVKPVCPEVECGLNVPRPSLRLEGDPEKPRLLFSVSGQDITEAMTAWAQQRVAIFKDMNLCAFIFKSASPSCDLHGVPVHTRDGQLVGKAPGLWARVFREAFPDMPVADEKELADRAVMIKFLKSL